MTTLIPDKLHPEQMLTTEQVSELTGIAKSTFEGWRCRKNGGPPFFKLGPQIIRYRWCSVVLWMAEGSAAAPSTPAWAEPRTSSPAA